MTASVTTISSNPCAGLAQTLTLSSTQVTGDNMTGPLLFNSTAKRHAWLKLANMVDEVGPDHIPCTQAPDLYFPEGDEIGGAHYVRLAKNACKKCPLILPCAEYAVKYREEYGVWGGLSPTDRKNIRRKRAENA
jgi:WhiB family redox-sensing transcriptional regulator